MRHTRGTDPLVSNVSAPTTVDVLMCTVVTERAPGEPLRILAIRDEFVTRAFDLPECWWPDQPTVVGGRDQIAGGSWCVSDPSTGLTALVLNRTERRTGTPSRGVLPLAAVRHGHAWTEHVSHSEMAGFTLVLAGPDGVVAWTWDAAELVRRDLDDGVHVFTTAGVDADDDKGRTLAREFSTRPWLNVVSQRPPSDDPAALIVRHEVDDSVYATVFGQLITATRGTVAISHSRTPWLPDSWVERDWRAEALPFDDPRRRQ